MKSNQPQIHTLTVSLQNRPIGIINRLAGDRHIFSFNENYIDDPERPTLSLSFKGQMGGLVTSPRIYNLRLPPFFSNLLPEGHLRTYLAERAGIKPEREFFLLDALGADLPGALTISAQTPDEFIHENLDISHHERRTDTALRFSLAGVQLKFSAILEASGGLTVPANGMNGSWIIKLPSTRFPFVPENEFVMLELARAAGMVLPRNKLINMSDIHGLPRDTSTMNGQALAVERFDRTPNGERIHMEDFAQIFGLYPEKKYENRSYANIAAVLSAETGETGVFEFIRRLVFSILIGNADMHLKNWSILYPDKRVPILSPAYDFVATLPYLPGDQLALNFGGSRSLNEISPDQIRRFADTARLAVNPVSRLVNETIERTVTMWESLDHKQLLPADIIKAIHQQIHTVASNTYKLIK